VFNNTLKYDFTFSAKAFVALAAIFIGLSVVLRFTMPIFIGVEYSQELANAMSLTLSLMLLGIGIASVTQIFQFFSRNFFGDAGYLMLTLPTGRLKLIVSKVAVSFVWFNFMVLTTVASIFIMWETAMQDINSRGVFSAIGAGEVAMLVQINSLAIFAICLMFFCITLGRSVFAGRRIHIVFSGIIGFGFGWLWFWATQQLSERSMEMVHRTMTLDDGRIANWYNNVQQVGLQYGRILLYETGGGWPIYIDIFHIGMSLAMAATLVVGTYYLLKHRASLR